MNKILFVSILLMAIIQCGCHPNQCTKGTPHEENVLEQYEVIVNKDTNYCKTIESIKDNNCGSSLYLQRKMILATAAEYYRNHFWFECDSCMPIVEVSFDVEYNDYDIYQISEIPPIFLNQGECTEIDICSNYIVCYRMKDEPVLTLDEIAQKGINTNCDMLPLCELSTYVALKKNSLEHLTVGEVFNHDNCIRILDSICNLQNGRLF